MLNLDLSNTQIQVAFISGFFTVLSALIAAVAAAILGKSIENRRKLQKRYETAIDDITFLLKVEELHCKHNKQEFGESRKNIVRQEVRTEHELKFSGKFTPGRVRSDRHT